MALFFEWDSRKAILNWRKHKVSFDEATTVFRDPLAVIFPDEDHSDGEEREIVIGHSILRRVILVFFAEVAERSPSHYQCAEGDTEGTEGI